MSRALSDKTGGVSNHNNLSLRQTFIVSRHLINVSKKNAKMLFQKSSISIFLDEKICLNYRQKAFLSNFPDTTTNQHLIPTQNISTQINFKKL